MDKPFLVAPAFGPIAPDVDTAALILKHLLVDELYKEDSRLAPVPWRDQVSLDVSFSRFRVQIIFSF